MRRKRLIALAVLPGILLAGDFFYWRLAVNQLRAGFENWTAGVRASGWDIRHGSVTAGGWPDAATLRIENLTIAASGWAGMNIGALHIRDVEWGSDTISFQISLTRPNTMEVIPLGLHPLRLNAGPPVPISAGDMRLRVTQRPRMSPSTMDIEADTLAGGIPGFGQVTIGHLSGHADLRLNAGRDQAVVLFSVSAQPLTLPDGTHWDLGPEIDEFAVDGVLNGPSPLQGQTLAERATSWRDAGGSLELHRLTIGWGQARLDATATLALDEDLQPMGAGTGKITGYGAALDALAAKAVLSRSAAQAAKAVLSLLATTPDDGQPEEVEVPLTLQFRTLSVRQVPLVRLPELDWPDH
jgi:hypothetical protein